MAVWRKRPRLRFRLRVLLLFVTLVCVWLGRTTYLARQQRDAISTVVKSEGHVIFDYEQDAQGVRIPNPKPPGPKWLRKTIGEDYFRSSIIVDFGTNLGRRRGTENPKVTLESLAALGQLRGVHTVELSHNESVTDDALACLADLRQLRVLYLYHTAVTGSGLASLKRLPLEALELSHSPLMNEGLKHFEDMRRLRYLGLDNTLVTDQGLAHLAELPKLKEVRVRNTDVSDAGLEHLRKIATLESVSLVGTNVTAEGVARLAKALPNCTIHANYGLGLQPNQELLFPEGYRPTTAEIKAKLKERNISCHIETDDTKTGQPITSFRLGQSTLGDQPILQLVQSMPELEFLSIDNSLAGDALLEGLAGSKRLNYLVIRGGRLSDDGLRHLIKISSLREIELHDQAFTDAAVEHLSNLQQLTALFMEQSKLTDDGRDALKRALPSCRLEVR